MNKKGASTSSIALGVVGILVLLFVFYVAYYNGFFSNVSASKGIVWLDGAKPNIDWNSPLAWVLTNAFGINEQKAETSSALVVLIAVWIIFFLAFGDTLENFGLFNSRGVAWMIGFLMAVILANMNLYYNLIVNLMALFSFLAAFSVIASLISVLVAMFVVNWGISGMAIWLQNRRTLLKVAKGEAKIKGGIRTLKGVAIETEAGE